MKQLIAIYCAMISAFGCLAQSAVPQNESLSHALYASHDDAQEVRVAPAPAEPENKIRLSFLNEPLVDIMYLMAEHKGFNILVPTGSPITSTKITLALDSPMTIDAAWDMFVAILDMCIRLCRIPRLSRESRYRFMLALLLASFLRPTIVYEFCIFSVILKHPMLQIVRYRFF
jgi:hypothetical protein